MHLYFITRGAPENTRRFIYELQRKYYNLKNKITGKQIGAIQLMPREIRSWECVFPETEKKNIKKFIGEQAAKANGGNQAVACHFVKFKKDKFVDGVEML